MATHDGWRFEPTDEQSVGVIEMKRLDPAFDHPIIKERDIYKYHPCELLGLSSMSNEQVGYFFCTLDPKHDKGKLQNRTAKGGSWKITCRDSKLTAKDSDKQFGIKKTLSFYEGSTTKKENWTDWKMYEYHEYPRKDNSPSKGEVVLCRIERKPNKKRKRSSALNNEQPIDSLACDSGNNVSEDILLVEPQLPQNLHLPSTYNNDVANRNLVEVETQPPPKQHIAHLMKDLFQELESQLLPNQLKSLIIEDAVAKYTFELESQLPPNQYVSPIIGDHVAKATLSQCEVVVCRIERKPDKNHEPSSTLDEGQPNNLVYDFGNNVIEDIVPQEEPDQVLKNLHLPSSSSNNYTENTNLMEVESQPLPMHYLPDVTKNQLESQPLPKQQKSLNDLVTEKNTSSEEESQLPPNQYMSSNGEDHVANDIFSGLEPLDPAGWYNPFTD